MCSIHETTQSFPSQCQSGIFILAKQRAIHMCDIGMYAQQFQMSISTHTHTPVFDVRVSE